MLRLDRPRRPPLRPIEALEVFMNSRFECRSSKDWGLGSSRLRPLPPPGPFWWWRGMAACWGVRGSLRPVPVGISLLTVGAVGLAGLLGRLSDRLSVLSTLPVGATPRSLVFRSIVLVALEAARLTSGNVRPDLPPPVLPFPAAGLALPTTFSITIMVPGGWLGVFGSLLPPDAVEGLGLKLGWLACLSNRPFVKGW